jgi:hypothetical protein
MALKEKETIHANWFYFYQRWVWIYFPWLALGNDVARREFAASTGTGSSHLMTNSRNMMQMERQ